MADVSKYGAKAQELKERSEVTQGTWQFVPRGQTQVVVLETPGAEADVYYEATSVMNGKSRLMGVMRVAIVGAENDKELTEGWENNIKALIVPPSVLTPLMTLMGQGYVPSKLVDGVVTPLDKKSGNSVFTIEKTGSGMETRYAVIPVRESVAEELVAELPTFIDIEDLEREARAYTDNQTGVAVADNGNAPF